MHIDNKDILSRECKHVVYVPATKYREEDIYLVKEIVTTKDNKVIPRINMLKNYKKPYFITKECYRDHKQKKESESRDRVDIYYCKESELATSIASRLGKQYNGVTDIRKIRDNPYVYGIDVDTRAIIKKTYMDKYPNAQSVNKVATLDIETNIETEEIVIITVAMGDKACVGILGNILKGLVDPIKELEYLYKKYIPENTLATKANVEYIIEDREEILISKVISRLHIWKPDFVAIWNMAYDIPYIVKRLYKFNIDPKDVFSDPDIPRRYRYFKYKEGMVSRVTASGVHKAKPIEEIWNVCTVASSFFIIDAMAAYWYVRVGGKKVPGGYSLDNILKKELGERLQKLKFKEDPKVDNLIGIDWHKFMLNNRPLHYIIYNIWDCYSMLELDLKTKDLSHTISILSDISSYDKFHSNPSRIIDTLYFYYLNNNRVLGCKPGKKQEVEHLGLDDWISMLPAHRIKDNGYKCLIEGDNVSTNVRGYTFDLDAVSSYPSNTQAANVSRDTTSKEILDIEGIPKQKFIINNINSMFGKVSSIDYCVNMFNFPNLYDLKIIEDK